MVIDHERLLWILNWSKPSSRQFYAWIEEIVQFDFTIEHRKADRHINADILSHLPKCHQCELKHENVKPKRMKNNLHGISNDHINFVKEQKHSELKLINCTELE